ncbi:MAG: hypothetical protein ACR9NN_21195 [Nostochopsis sp.]
MIIVLKPNSPAEEIEYISQELSNWNVRLEKSVGKHKLIIGLIGDTAEIAPKQIQNLSQCIEQVLRVEKPFKRASLEFRYGEPSEVVVSTPNGKVGATNKPVLLKRGASATIEEWLMASEYILAAGNPNVILCERGIRSFDGQYTRNTLDISAIPVLRSLTHLPIMIDPSHGTGKAEYVPTMAMAAVAAGADSLMIEVHPNPAKALSDGPQSLTLEEFEQFMQQMSYLGKFFGRWVENQNQTLALQVSSNRHL